MIPEGWTAHDGGTQPTSDDTPVKVKYRGPEDSAKGVRIPFSCGARFDWTHDGGPDDIIAYQEVK